MRKLFLTTVLTVAVFGDEAMTQLQFAEYCQKHDGVLVSSLFDVTSTDQTFLACRDQFSRVIALNVQSFSMTIADKPEAIRAFEKLSREVRIEAAIRDFDISKLERMRMIAEKAKTN